MFIAFMGRIILNFVMRFTQYDKEYCPDMLIGMTLLCATIFLPACYFANFNSFKVKNINLRFLLNLIDDQQNYCSLQFTSFSCYHIFLS